MIWVAGALVSAVDLAALVLVAGILHMRHSVRVAEATLRDECVRVFRETFGETLDLNEYEASAQVLSGRLDDLESLKRAFAREDCYWHFALPVGAFMGELLRVHANGAWRGASPEFGGLELAIALRGDFAQTDPFHKIIKHATTGAPGDIYAYFLSAHQLEKITEHVDGEEP